MTQYICPECGQDLVQMLERTPWDDRKEWTQTNIPDVSSKHYGFYCKFCHEMYRQKWYLIKDEDFQSSEQKVSE